MLVLGMDSIPRLVGSGVFYCLQCLDERGYRRQKVRSFFTIYYVPVIPLAVEGEYIECGACLSTFEPNVLAAPESCGEFTPHFKKTIVRMMAIMASIDNHIHAKETNEIVHICDAVISAPALSDDLESYFEGQAQGMKADGVLNFLKHSRSFLNTVGREKVFIAALRIAQADSTLHPSEMSFLHQIGTALGLDRGHVAELMEDTARTLGRRPPRL